MRGMLLKEKRGLQWKRRVEAPHRTGAAESLLRQAGFCFGGFLLAAGQAAGRPLPLAACLVFLAGVWPGALAALAGACGGYLLFWGWAGAMEPLALSLSFFSAAVIFRNTPISGPALCAGLTGAVGVVFLLDSGLSGGSLAHLLASAASAGLAPVLWDRAKDRLRARRLCGVLLLGCLAAAVPPYGAALGAALAFTLLTVGGSLPGTVLCGAAIDLNGALPLPVTGILALGLLLCRLAAADTARRRACLLVCGALAWQLFFGRLSLLFCLSAGLGCGAGCLLPPQLTEPVAALARKRTRDAAPQPQPGVERALESMHRVLMGENPALSPEELSRVYDFAAEKVCRCCVCFGRCWEQQAEETYQDLCAAGEAILLRGTALREDLPARFADRCRHTEGFLTAVNQSLDAQRAGRREEYRRWEDCRIAAGQYLLLARLLHRVTEPGLTAPLSYTPELAVGTARRTDSPVSGDRGATCRDRFGNFYVLLCDGMGSGPAARAESDRAARLLTALLEAGAAADSALELLNGFYLLRRQTVFSTVDLLQLSLLTGEGTLYKWGAAPSYLRSGEAVQKIGTGTPPPGCGVGEAHSPGRYALSLKTGETLVMVSDGACGEETERRLAEVSHGTVRDLASCLITLGGPEAADDRTAVVLRLRPVDLKTA